MAAERGDWKIGRHTNAYICCFSENRGFDGRDVDFFEQKVRSCREVEVTGRDMLCGVVSNCPGYKKLEETCVPLRHYIVVSLDWYCSKRMVFNKARVYLSR